jgi:hypothetical protein
MESKSDVQRVSLGSKAKEAGLVTDLADMKLTDPSAEPKAERNSFVRASSKSSMNDSSAKLSAKESQAERMDEEDADNEFEALMRKPNSGGVEISTSTEERKIAKGLRINMMNMRDADTGRMLWESRDWGDDVFSTELRAEIPKEILKSKVVTREINFSSMAKIDKFRIEQRVIFKGHCIEGESSLLLVAICVCVYFLDLHKRT